MSFLFNGENKLLYCQQLVLSPKMLLTLKLPTASEEAEIDEVLPNELQELVNFYKVH